MLRSGAFEGQAVTLPTSIMGDAGTPPSMEAALQRVMEQMRGGRPSGAPHGPASGSQLPVRHRSTGQQQEQAVSGCERGCCGDGVAFGMLAEAAATVLIGSVDLRTQSPH